MPGYASIVVTISFQTIYLDSILVLEKLTWEAFSGIEGTAENDLAVDNMWYLWAGPESPLFGKDKMNTFERYFIKDISVHKGNEKPFLPLQACP